MVISFKLSSDDDFLRFHCQECCNYDVCNACYDGYEANVPYGLLCASHDHSHRFFPASKKNITLQTEISQEPTTSQALQKAWKLFAPRPCLGFRAKISETQFENKYTWFTYEQIEKRSLAVAAGELAHRYISE